MFNGTLTYTSNLWVSEAWLNQDVQTHSTQCSHRHGLNSPSSFKWVLSILAGTSVGNDIIGAYWESGAKGYQQNWRWEFVRGTAFISCWPIMSKGRHPTLFQLDWDQAASSTFSSSLQSHSISVDCMTAESACITKEIDCTVESALGSSNMLRL